MTTTTRTAFELARMAECYSPDSDSSPGAKFLDDIEADYNDRIENGDYDEDDSPHEIADAAVPVYTHERWQVFVDLGAYEEDPSELGAQPDDMTECAAACLYLIADRLVRTLHEARDEDEDA